MSDVDELETELEEPNDNEWDDERFQSRMDHVANASANIGTLLLKGWTMLADVCQTCHSPLMQLAPANPRCVVCNPVKEENKANQNTIIISNQPTTKTQPPSTNNQSNLTDIDELKELNDKLWNDNDEAFQKRMQKSEDTSKKLGQYLLKGWTMLSDHCNKCQTPLMSLRGGDSMCVNCDSNKDRNNELQKQKAKAIAKVQKIQSTLESIKEKPKEQNRGNVRENMDNNNVASQRRQNENEIRRNGFDFEQKRNEDYYNYNGGRYGYSNYGYAPPPPMVFGFGARQDEQMRRTLGDIVKTVLDKMNVINDRMSRSDNSLENDVNELNKLMEFLLNVQKFKSQLRR